MSESFSPKALETPPPSLQGEGESRLQSLFIVELASYLQELPRAVGERIKITPSDNVLPERPEVLEGKRAEQGGS